MTCIRKLIICRGSFLGFCAIFIAVAAGAQTPCAGTPKEAAASSVGQLASRGAAAAPGTGFRIWRVRNDPELKRRWVWVVSCDAPGHPAQILSAPLRDAGESQAKEGIGIGSAAGGQASRTGEPPLVRRGDAVVVFESGKAYSMRLSGVALEVGRRGDKIRIRLTALHGTVVVTGTVAGKDEIRL
jgi:hypothetical protein